MNMLDAGKNAIVNDTRGLANLLRNVYTFTSTVTHAVTLQRW